MKGSLKTILVLALLATVSLLTVGCNIYPEEQNRLEGRLYFHNGKDQAMLIDSNGSLICLSSDTKGAFEDFNTGDFVEVKCGAMLESYPAQTTISEIKLIKRGDESSITAEEWEKLSEVYPDLADKAGE